MFYQTILKESSERIDENLIKMIEMYLQINFPKSYRDFLISCNGGETTKRIFLKEKNGYVIDFFLGFLSDQDLNILIYYRDYKDRIPSNMFPIGYDPFGNLILISVKNADRGKIYFWDHEREADEGEIPDYSNLTLIADTFDEFIQGLKNDEEIEDLK